MKSDNKGDRNIIDEIDASILKSLLVDARTKFSDIAKKCNVSTNSIAKRFHKLKRLGIIKGTSLKLNMETVGYRYVITLDVNIENGFENQVESRIRRYPSIVTCYKMIGKYDLHVVFLAKTFEQIGLIRNSIKKIKGVLKVSFTANLEKVNFMVDNLEILQWDCKNYE